MKQILIYKKIDESILNDEYLKKQNLIFEQDFGNIEKLSSEIKIDLLITEISNIVDRKTDNLISFLCKIKIPLLVIFKNVKEMNRFKEMIDFPFIDFLILSELKRYIEIKVEKIINIRNFIVSIENMYALQYEIGKISKLSVAGELIGSIGHMINNPITAINLQLDMIKMDNSCSKNVIRKINLIEQNIERIISIVSTVRELKLGISEKSELINIDEEILKFLPILKDYFINHNVEIESNYDKKIPPVKLPSGFLKYVFLELILLIFHRSEKKSGSRIVINFLLKNDSIVIEFNTNFIVSLQKLFEQDDEQAKSDKLTLNSVKFDIENISGKILFYDNESSSKIEILLPLPVI